MSSRRRQSLLIYMGVAYPITWLVWWPYLRAATTGAAPPGPYLYYLGALGPFLAAFGAEAYERGRRGIEDLAHRLLDVRGPRGWIAVGLLSPLLLVPAAGLCWHAVTGAWPAWRGLGVTGRAPGLGPLVTWGLMTISYGVGEETGWRGFLLPRLQGRRSALAATALLVPIWAGWHLPAFWFREGYVELGVAGGLGFLVGLTAGAVVLTALYNASGGSVLVVALWHGGWNWVATSDALQGPWVATMTVIVIVTAPLLVWGWGARDLAPRARPRLADVASRSTSRPLAGGPPQV